MRQISTNTMKNVTQYRIEECISKSLGEITPRVAASTLAGPAPYIYINDKYQSNLYWCLLNAMSTVRFSAFRFSYANIFVLVQYKTTYFVCMDERNLSIANSIAVDEDASRKSTLKNETRPV